MGIVFTNRDSDMNESMDVNRIGKSLKKFRLSRSESLEELESRSGVHRSHISQIERGKRPQVAVVTIARLAEALNLELVLKVK